MQAQRFQWATASGSGSTRGASPDVDATAIAAKATQSSAVKPIAVRRPAISTASSGTMKAMKAKPVSMPTVAQAR